MRFSRTFIKNILGVLIISSWILLVWKSYGDGGYLRYRISIGLLYAMVYAPWLYACFNKAGKFTLLPPLPKTYQNNLWKFNAIANLLPAFCGLLYFLLPGDRFEKGFLTGWASEVESIIISLGLKYWYISYVTYLLMQGFSRFNWRKACLCTGLIMFLSFLFYFLPVIK